jgi:hypothetical protein
LHERHGTRSVPIVETTIRPPAVRSNGAGRSAPALRAAGVALDGFNADRDHL